MFDKLLVIVDFAKENKYYFKECISLANKLSSQIIAFNVIDINTTHLIAKHTQKRESEVAVDLEEDGWKYLYMFEDMAKNAGVKTLINQEEGVFESKLLEAVSKYKIDLLCLKKNLNLGIQSRIKFLERILEKVNCPLLLL